MKKFLPYMTFVATSAVIFLVLQFADLLVSSRFTAVANTKTFWGMIGDNTFSLSLAIFFLVIFLCLVYVYRHRSIYWPSLLVVSGTASNIYERFAYGQIRDYAVLHFSAVNLADLLITIGIFFFFWQIFEKKSRH